MWNPETWGYSAHESILVVIYHALGYYLLVLPVASYVAFYLTLKILRQGQGPLAASLLLLIVPAPLLIGLFGGWQGAVRAFATTAPPGAVQSQEIFYGLGMAMFPPFLGLLLTMPAYAFAIAGTFSRSLSGEIPSSVRTGSPPTTYR